MASLANDMKLQGKPAKAPLAAHPAFPFIVALWFAALLGLGSLVVPVPVIERIVVATGIAGIVPAAMPPLGFTARALMALAFTCGGALVGLLIARQVAKANNAGAAALLRTPAKSSGRQPIFAHAELGNEGLDGRTLTPRGRRALAIDNEERPSDFLELAPMPGAASEFGPDSFVPYPRPLSENEPENHFDSDELELTEFHLAHEPAEAAATAMPGFSAFATDTGNVTMDDRQVFERPHGNDEPADSEQAGRQDVRYSVKPVSHIPPAAAPAVVLTMTNAWSPAQDVEHDDDVRAGYKPARAAPIPADALQFSPPSLARQVFCADADVAAADEDSGNEGSVDKDSEEAEVNDDYRQSGPANFSATDGANDGEMADVGLVQLAQRLGASIEKRREMLAARAAMDVAASAPVIAEDFEMAAPDEAAEAMAAYFSQPQAVQPATAVAEDTVEEGTVEEDDAEEDVAEAGMPSLEAITPRPKVHSGARQIFEPVADPADETAGKFHPMTGLARIDIDEDDEEDDVDELAASFSLPLGRSNAVPASPVVDNAQSLGLGPVLGPVETSAQQAVFHGRQEFVRIEDEPEIAEDEVQPAVVFPAEAASRKYTPAYAPAHIPAQTVFESEAYQTQARINTEEHERALRDALLNLQRMSGTA